MNFSTNLFKYFAGASRNKFLASLKKADFHYRNIVLRTPFTQDVS